MKSLEVSLDKKPSPGYIYPLLHELKDQRFVTSENKGRRTIYHCTPKGKKFLKELCSEFETMRQEVVSRIEPLSGKKEFEEYKQIHAELMKHIEKIMTDFDLISAFYGSVLKVYKTDYEKKRKKFRNLMKNYAEEISKI